MDERIENDITQPIKNGKMGTKQFLIRLSLWVLFAAIVPIGYLAYRFDIFNGNASHSLTGWGIIAIIIAAVFMVSLIREVLVGLPQGSMVRQCVKGAMSLIPLFLFILLVDRVKKSMDEFETFLIILLISEAIAVPINPLPKWGVQNNVEFMKMGVLDIAKSVVDYSKSKDKE